MVITYNHQSIDESIHNIVHNQVLLILWNKNIAILAHYVVQLAAESIKYLERHIPNL